MAQPHQGDPAELLTTPSTTTMTSTTTTLSINMMLIGTISNMLTTWSGTLAAWSASMPRPVVQALLAWRRGGRRNNRPTSPQRRQVQAPAVLGERGVLLLLRGFLPLRPRILCQFLGPEQEPLKLLRPPVKPLSWRVSTSTASATARFLPAGSKRRIMLNPLSSLPS